MPVEATSPPRSLPTNDKVPGTKPRQSELPALSEPLASHLVPSCFRSRVRPKNLIRNSCSRSRDLAKALLGSRIWLLRIFLRGRANMHPWVTILPQRCECPAPAATRPDAEPAQRSIGSDQAAGRAAKSASHGLPREVPAAAGSHVLPCPLARLPVRLGEGVCGGVRGSRAGSLRANNTPPAPGRRMGDGEGLPIFCHGNIFLSPRAPLPRLLGLHD